MGRFPWVTATKAYVHDIRTVIDDGTLVERERKLRYLGRILQEARDRGEVGTTDPAKIGKDEVDWLVLWMRTKGLGLGYQAKLWELVRALLRYAGNGTLDRLEARGLWRMPKKAHSTPLVKDEAWARDALQRLETEEGWCGEAVRFCVSFFLGTGVRSKELRLADVRDLDTKRWVFRVMHPKGERAGYGVVGAELDIYSDTRQPIMDFLDARERHLRDIGLDPTKVLPLVPNEDGEHYSLNGWNNMRGVVFRRLGIEGDWRTLRRTHGQILVDRLEASGFKEGAVIEIGSKRLRNTMTTFQRFYADLRTTRARDVAREAWESGARISIPPD